MPLRQCLGRLQLRAGLAADADATYRADLDKFIANGWSLWGLVQAMEAQPDRYTPAAVDEVKAQLKRVWKRADIPLTSSCFALE